MPTTTGTPPDPVNATPQELKGNRARVKYEAGEAFQGMVCAVEQTTRDQRIIHINFQNSVVRSVDPRQPNVAVCILEEENTDDS